MSYARIDRISHEIQREMASIIPMLKDPRIPEVISVVAADVTRDLSFATIYVSVYGDKEKQDEAIKGLNSAKSFVRKEIAKRVQLRITPEISFVVDDSIKQGSHISDLLSKIKNHDEQ